MLYSVATLGLYLRDLNGTAAPQLLIPDQIAASPDEPAWLPDGSGFLYRSGNEIWQADAHGMQRQRLLVAARDERFVRPSASPDGRWIVFERQIGSDSTLWLMQRDDPTSVRPLVTGRQPDWSRVSPTRPARIWGNGFEASSPVSRGRGQP
jgi:Tol biopolymer transport system component